MMWQYAKRRCYQIFNWIWLISKASWMSIQKIIWLCSPNNPTGNTFLREDIETILNNFHALVVIDEAYINFSRQHSFTRELAEYPNLVVLQTFSKAWGLAGLRLGMAFASEEIIAILNKVKPPYNISQATQEIALQALQNVTQVNQMIVELVNMREALAEVFCKNAYRGKSLSVGSKIFYL